MNNASLQIVQHNSELTLIFSGELNVYNIEKYNKNLKSIDFTRVDNVEVNVRSLNFIDTAGGLFLNKTIQRFQNNNVNTTLLCENQDILKTLELVQRDITFECDLDYHHEKNIAEVIGKSAYAYYIGFLSFMAFLGNLFATKLHYLSSVKNIRFKEIAFEINESGIKALGIVSLTSFLIGLVVAYQSAFQLKIYGANIFVVDMLGISILRELAPLITAIVIAGRSGSAFTAQIGAMKITEELDAMRTMGFDPYIFLVVPRIIALMIVLPILIFVADMMGIIGGMVVAHVNLDIGTQLFLDRFNEVVAMKHFVIGLAKGPFFAFLIASIGIYRGLQVKNDTQSIGFSTTKSVVESIFTVIVCDAIFSIIFTNLGI